MTNPSPIAVAGIDVGKSRLDAHVHGRGPGRHFQNNKTGRRGLRNWLLRQRVSRAVLEPTGRCHRNLHQCLHDAGLETVLASPLRSRRFAEALGQLARNDRVDAAMLARFGLLAGLEATPPRAGNLRRLSDLLTVRRQLVKQRDALRKLRAGLAPEAAGCLGAPLDALRAGISSCDRRLRECIADDAGLARRDATIQSVPGCGPVTAACLCADMPELGSLGRCKAASLFGVAPFDRDSGQIRGGRAQPRHLPCMAALPAIRWEASSEACPQRLLANGKKPKVALVAVMRRLAGLLDTLLREGRHWQPEPPAPTLQVLNATLFRLEFFGLFRPQPDTRRPSGRRTGKLCCKKGQGGWAEGGMVVTAVHGR